MDIAFHYPPELLQLLVDTIPRLSRSKRDVLLFFQGAGVPEAQLSDLRLRLSTDARMLNKFEITRTVLTRLNERGESTLRERREVLKRVVEFEDFSTCWPEDQLKAKGLVSEIRRVVNVKDSFTRIQQERSAEATKRKEELAAKVREFDEQRRLRSEAKDELFAAFAETNAQRRGSKLESALNRLFRAHGILIKESFRIASEKTGTTLEQIDAVIELDTHLYFVEVKWLSSSVDINDVSRHLIRVYHRGQSRGLFISATEFTESALETCRDALQRTVIALCMLDELVHVLEQDQDLSSFLRKKITAAQTDKQPFVRFA